MGRFKEREGGRHDLAVVRPDDAPFVSGEAEICLSARAL